VGVDDKMRIVGVYDITWRVVVDDIKWSGSCCFFWVVENRSR
jgi:hypothetical protein